jgi:hypothetical protein
MDQESQSQKTILVVDDERVWRETVGAQFQCH